MPVTDKMFDEWYDQEFKWASPVSSAQVRTLKAAFLAGYNQRASEEHENTRLLEGILGGMRIDP